MAGQSDAYMQSPPSSEDEWFFEVEGYQAEDADLEPALLVVVRQQNLSVLGKSFVLLRVLEKLKGFSTEVELSVQEGALPYADRVEEKPCWLLRAGDSRGTEMLRRYTKGEIKVSSAGVPDFPRDGKPEIVVECGDLVPQVVGGLTSDALLDGAAGLPSFAALGLGLFTGAAIVGTGLVRNVQSMPWVQGPTDLCAMTVERCLARQAKRQGYVLELLPCTDAGSACFGRKFEKAAPAGKRPTDKVNVAFGAKFRFRAKPAEEAAGAAAGLLKLPLEVAFPLGGVGVPSAGSSGSRVKVTPSTTSVDAYYCSTAGMQALLRVVVARGIGRHGGSGRC